MEGKILLDHSSRSVSSEWVGWKLRSKPSNTSTSPVVVAVLTRPTITTTTIGADNNTTTTTIYKDNFFDRIAINHLSRSMQIITGKKNEKRGYEGLVEAASTVSRSFSDTNKQQEMVLKSLNKAFPRPILSMIRFLLPQTKFTRECFAIFTTLFFAWLVGPCEVKESEVEGRIEKNVVHIKKCRFLEESNCVGMCINLCKMPSQMFIKDSLGMPVNMVPNFDDMSCEMIYGQNPPSLADDPAFRQPCFKTICKSKQKHTSGCSTL